MISRKGFGSNGVVCEVEVKKDLHPGNLEKNWININHSCFATAKSGPEMRFGRCTQMVWPLELKFGKAS